MGAYYSHGFSSDEYKDGEYLGYSLHNESVYNSSVLYVHSHRSGFVNIRGGRDIYFSAYGYIRGYRTWRDEIEVSKMNKLLEID